MFLMMSSISIIYLKSVSNDPHLGPTVEMCAGVRAGSAGTLWRPLERRRPRCVTIPPAPGGYQEVSQGVQVLVRWPGGACVVLGGGQCS